MLKLINSWLRVIRVDINKLKEGFKPLSITDPINAAIENLATLADTEGHPGQLLGWRPAPAQWRQREPVGGIYQHHRQFAQILPGWNHGDDHSSRGRKTYQGLRSRMRGSASPPKTFRTFSTVFTAGNQDRRLPPGMALGLPWHTRLSKPTRARFPRKAHRAKARPLSSACPYQMHNPFLNGKFSRIP